MVIKAALYSYLRVFIVFLALGFFVSVTTQSIDAYDEFLVDSLDITKWDQYQNSGQILVQNGLLSLSKNFNSDRSPYVTSTEFALNRGYKVTVKYKIMGPYNYGGGLAFSQESVPNLQLNGNYHSNVLLEIWPTNTSGNIGMLAIKLCGENEVTCVRQFNKIKDWTIDSSWREVTMSRDSDDIYRIYSDADLIFTSKPTDVVTNSLWFGNPEKTPLSQNIFPSIEIDYVRISPLLPEPPPEPVKDKIIVLPGVFSSWDYDAILNGSNGDNWSIPSWISVYDDLFRSLENAGYIRNEDYFVFAYDWRKSLFQLDNQLDDFVNNLRSEGKISNTDKIDFVGHSYGGLVARSYAQNYDDDGVDQVVTLGSPHYGATQAYGLWEGMQTWNSPWWQNQMIQMLVRFNRGFDESKVMTLRRMAPSIQDVLPTYDFLYRDGNVVPVSDMFQQNQTLPSLNGSADSAFVKAIVGTGVDTFGDVTVRDRSKQDELLGLWQDGKPIERRTSIGDGTVLIDSARGPFSDYTEVLAGHQEVISDAAGLNELFDRLGIDGDLIVDEGQGSQPTTGVVAVLRSPGRLELRDGSGNMLSNVIEEHEGKILFAPGLVNGNYVVKVVGNGESGDYVVHLGNISENDSSWTMQSGSLMSGDEIDTLVFELDGSNIEMESGTELDGDSRTELEFELNDLYDRFAQETEVKKQLKILRKMKVVAHKLHAKMVKNDDEDMDRSAELIEEFDRWSSELIEDSGYEITKKQVNRWMGAFKNFEKYIRKLATGNENLILAMEKIQSGNDFYNEKKYALADEYYYSGWLYLKEALQF